MIGVPGPVNDGDTVIGKGGRLVTTSEAGQGLRSLISGYILSVAGGLTQSRTWTFPDRSDTFAGLGAQTFSGLQNLSSGITVSGTVTLPATSIADAALSTNVALRGSVNTFTSAQTINSTLTVTGNAIFGTGGGVSSISVGDNSSGNGAIKLFGASTQKGWQVGSNITAADSLEFTPATAAGGTSFSSPAAVLTAVGNLGIGITPSSAKLEVKQSSEGVGAGIRLIRPGSSIGYNIQTDSAGGFTFSSFDGTSWTDRAYFNRGGSLAWTFAQGIGIGTDPTAGNGLLQFAIGTTKANGSAYGDTYVYRDASQSLTVDGDLRISIAGKGLRIKEGTNAKMGVSTLVAGTVVVANSSITTTSRIMLTNNAVVGTAGFLVVSARTAGTGFTILSSNLADTSTIAWDIKEPG
jgi:hypothetical protein